MNHEPGFHLSCDANLSKGWGPPLDAQAQWAELEKKWERFAAEAELRQSAKDIGAAARALGDELKAGFEGIKKGLR